MLKEFVTTILELKRPEKVEMDGRAYFTSKLHPATEPEPDALQVRTLTGLVDYLGLGEVSSPIIHIVSASRVELRGGLTEDFAQRFKFLISDCGSNAFSFGAYQSIESFIINVQCCFVDTPEKKALVDFMSSVTGEDVATVEDNGIAQTVAIKNAIGRAEKAKTSPITKLRPYRTFNEIEQPEGQYLLRMKRQPGGLPQVALFGADNDLWQNKAMDAIKGYLTKATSGKNVSIIS